MPNRNTLDVFWIPRIEQAAKKGPPFFPINGKRLLMAAFIKFNTGNILMVVKAIAGQKVINRAGVLNVGLSH